MPGTMISPPPTPNRTLKSPAASPIASAVTGAWVISGRTTTPVPPSAAAAQLPSAPLSSPTRPLRRHHCLCPEWNPRQRDEASARGASSWERRHPACMAGWGPCRQDAGAPGQRDATLIRPILSRHDRGARARTSNGGSGAGRLRPAELLGVGGVPVLLPDRLAVQDGSDDGRGADQLPDVGPADPRPLHHDQYPGAAGVAALRRAARGAEHLQAERAAPLLVRRRCL